MRIFFSSSFFQCISFSRIALCRIFSPGGGTWRGGDTIIYSTYINWRIFFFPFLLSMYSFSRNCIMPHFFSRSSVSRATPLKINYGRTLTQALQKQVQLEEVITVVLPFITTLPSEVLMSRPEFRSLSQASISMETASLLTRTCLFFVHHPDTAKGLIMDLCIPRATVCCFSWPTEGLGFALPTRLSTCVCEREREFTALSCSPPLPLRRRQVASGTWRVFFVTSFSVYGHTS